MTLLMTLAVSHLASLLHMERSGRDLNVASSAMLRLSEQFRKDAADAAGLTLPEAGVSGVPIARFAGEGDTAVEYVLRPGGLARREIGGEVTRSLDTFVLPEDSVAEVVVTGEDTRWAELWIRRRTPRPEEPGRPLLRLLVGLRPEVEIDRAP